MANSLPSGVPASAPICPHCGQLDAVRKVSAIVASGVTSTTTHTQTDIYATGSGRIGRDGVATSQHTAVSYSALAERLAPPKKPEEEGGCGSYLFAFLGLCVVMLLIFRELFPLVLVIILVTYGLYNMLPGVQAKKKHEKEAYQEKLAAYEKRLDEWHRSYHCSRCDKVFVKE